MRTHTHTHRQTYRQTKRGMERKGRREKKMKDCHINSKDPTEETKCGGPADREGLNPERLTVSGSAGHYQTETEQRKRANRETTTLTPCWLLASKHKHTTSYWHLSHFKAAVQFCRLRADRVQNETKEQRRETVFNPEQRWALLLLQRCKNYQSPH